MVDEYLSYDKVRQLIKQANQYILIPELKEGEFKEKMIAAKKDFSLLINKHSERIEDSKSRDFLLFVANSDSYKPEERLEILKSLIKELL